MGAVRHATSNTLLASAKFPPACRPCLFACVHVCLPGPVIFLGLTSKLQKFCPRHFHGSRAPRLESRAVQRYCFLAPTALFFGFEWSSGVRRRLGEPEGWGSNPGWAPAFFLHVLGRWSIGCVYWNVVFF
jgi:hypothetical protein